MTRGSADSEFGRSGMRLTRGVRWLLIVNFTVFLLELVIGRFDGGLAFLLDNLALNFDQCLFEGKVWQPLTSIFLHDPMGVSHIVWNMLALWMFGSPLEQFWGLRRFLWFYFITGLAASFFVLLVALIVPSQREIHTLGASGALYALLVAFGFNYSNTSVYFFGLFPLKGKHLVMVFVGLGVLESLTLGSNTSLAGHFGGMLTGFLVVTGLWRPTKVWKSLRLWIMKLRYRRLKRRLRLVDQNNDQTLN